MPFSYDILSRCLSSGPPYDYPAAIVDAVSFQPACNNYVPEKNAREDAAAAPADRPLPFTPLDQRLQAGGAPAGTRFERKIKPASWRAFSLRRPYLCSLLVLSLALLGGIEALRQISERHHGLQHLSGLHPTRLSTGQNILYSYIPTVIAVLYSILWSYIDSDSKRLEPYIQMRSRPSPASTRLLDYVFESAFVTPIRAVRRRHWTLAAVSTIFLLVSLILPASQGALFGINSVTYSVEEDSFSLSGKHFLTLSGGEFVLNVPPDPEPLFAHDVLLIANLSYSDTPSCSLTVGITIRMFYLDLQPEYLFPIWTCGFNTTAATSRIVEVSVDPPKLGDAQYNIILNSSEPVWWRDNVNSCPDRDRLAGLVALSFSNLTRPWDNNLSTIDLSFALYACKSESKWATARVTADANTQAVVDIDQLASQATSPFDTSAFEYFLELGRVQTEDTNASEPGLWAITHYQSIGDVVINNMTSQIGQRSSFNSLLSDNSVGDAFKVAYKLIFALYWHEFLRVPAEQYTVNGTTHVDTLAVVVVPAFAIISEASLLLQQWS